MERAEVIGSVRWLTGLLCVFVLLAGIAAWALGTPAADVAGRLPMVAVIFALALAAGLIVHGGRRAGAHVIALLMRRAIG